MPDRCLLSWEQQEGEARKSGSPGFEDLGQWKGGGVGDQTIASSSNRSDSCTGQAKHANSTTNDARLDQQDGSSSAAVTSQQHHSPPCWQSWLTIAVLLAPSDMAQLHLHPSQFLTLRSAGPHTVLVPPTPTSSNIITTPPDTQHQQPTPPCPTHLLPPLTITVYAVPYAPCPPKHVMLAPPLMHALRLRPHMRTLIAAVWQPPTTPPIPAAMLPPSSPLCLPDNQASSKKVAPPLCSFDHHQQFSSGSITVHHLLAPAPPSGVQPVDWLHHSPSFHNSQPTNVKQQQQQKLSWAGFHNLLIEQLGGGTALQGVRAWHQQQMQGLHSLLVLQGQQLQPCISNSNVLFIRSPRSVSPSSSPSSCSHSVLSPLCSTLPAGSLIHLAYLPQPTARGPPSTSPLSTPARITGCAYIMVAASQQYASTAHQPPHPEAFPQQQPLLPRVELGPSFLPAVDFDAEHATGNAGRPPPSLSTLASKTAISGAAGAEAPRCPQTCSCTMQPSTILLHPPLPYSIASVPPPPPTTTASTGAAAAAAAAAVAAPAAVAATAGNAGNSHNRSSAPAAPADIDAADLGCLLPSSGNVQGGFHTTEARCTMLNVCAGACSGGMELQQAMRRVEWVMDVLEGTLHQVRIHK